MSSDTCDSPSESSSGEITFEAFPDEFVDEFREDLEAIAEEVSPALPIIEGLLESRDRGEFEC